MKKIGSIAVLALVALGCKPKAPGYVPQALPHVEPVSISADAMPDLMPIADGNQWRFTLQSRVDVDQSKETSGDLNQEMIYHIVKAYDSEGNKNAIFELTQGNEVVDRQHWEITKDGIYQLTAGVKNVGFTPRQPIVLFPATPGKKFEWTGTGTAPDGSFAKMTNVSTIREPQKVDTEQGAMEAIPIETITHWGSHGETSDSVTWMAPHMGIVRFHQVLHGLVKVAKGRPPVLAQTTMTLKLTHFQRKL